MEPRTRRPNSTADYVPKAAGQPPPLPPAASHDATAGGETRSGGTRVDGSLASLPATVLFDALCTTRESGGSGKPPDWPVLPGYEILDVLGQGGMGVVYKARDLRLNRVVALKMILARQVASEAQARRFRREAEAAAHLDHAGIVPVYGFGEHEGKHFLAMGHVDGTSLQARLAAGPLDNRAAGYIVRAIAEAVDYAHRRGIVHRDLKPANILIGRDGSAWVTDFGIARRTGVPDEQGDDERLGLVPAKAMRRMTMTGWLLGTPSYMAPEQALDAKRVGPAADVYALGAILYAALTCRPPFVASSVRDTLELVVGSEPLPPHQLNPEVDTDLEEMCLRCLNKDPTARYASAADLAADLERWQLGQRPAALSGGTLDRLAQAFEARPAMVSVAAGLIARLLVGVQEGVFVGCLTAAMGMTAVTTRRRLVGVATIAGLVGAMTIPLIRIFEPENIHFPTLLLGCVGGAVLAILLVIARRNMAVLSGGPRNPWTTWYRRFVKLSLLTTALVLPLAFFGDFVLHSPPMELVWLADLLALIVGGSAVLLGLALLVFFQAVLSTGLIRLYRRLDAEGLKTIALPLNVVLFFLGLALGLYVLTRGVWTEAVDELIDGLKGSLFEEGTRFEPRIDSESGWKVLRSFLDRYGFGLIGVLAAIPLGLTTGLLMGRLRRLVTGLPLPNAGGLGAAFLLGALLGGLTWQAWLAGIDDEPVGGMARLGNTPATVVIDRLASGASWFMAADGWPLFVLLKMLLLVLPMATGGLLAVGIACLIQLVRSRHKRNMAPAA